MLREIGLNPDPIFARVFIDDQLVPKSEWEWAVPKAGQQVTVRVIPTGGGQGKDALRIVAMIGVITLAAVSAGAGGAPLGGFLGFTGAAAQGIGSAIIASTVSIVGSLAVTALIPPQKQNLADLGGLGNTSPTLSLTGSQNRLAPYAPIPRVYGRHRMYPPMAAKPFTEVVGSDQYLRLCFCFGYGPLALSELKIGETPIEQFQNLDLEIRYGFATDAPLTLYPDQVDEDALSIKLTFANGFQQRTSQPNAKQLSVDITCPLGLSTYAQVGEVFQFVQTAVQVQIDYRKVGDVGWTTVTSIPESHGAVTTAWSGANNDLIFTAVVGGTPGNGYAIIFVESTGLSVELNGTSTISIGYVPESTTSAAVKAALEASSSIMAVISVAHAPGNTGAGTIPAAPSGGGFTMFQTTGGYYAPGDGFIVDLRQSLVRANWTWDVSTPGAQYEVRVKRVTADATDPVNVRNETWWTMLRTVQSGQPVRQSGLCLVAMRIKATDQLNGTIDQFNGVASSLLKDWTGTAWELRETSNPAAIYRDILQGSANAKALADSRIDLTTLQTWHAENSVAGRTFNAVIDYQTTVFELLRTVAAAGRGSFTLRDGQYSVVRDLPQTTPIQTFTPRNSWGFKGTKTFVDLPHALKVRFINPNQNWQQDERFVYADGYTAANATKFETLDLMGVTDADQAWKAGRYHLAVATLRPESYELNVDVENLICTRGDLVRVVHDVPLFGAGWGRVKSVTTDGGGNATAVTFDDTVTMDGAKLYAARFRKSDGTTVVQQVMTVAGDQTSLTFTAAIASASKPAIGDLMLFGEFGRESIELIVKEIQPDSDLTAKLILLDAAPAVHTADTGPIPMFDSQITLPVVVPPPMPVITQVQSDESVLLRDVDGSYQSRILVTLHFTSGFRMPVSRIEAQYRPVGSEASWSQLFAPISGTAVDVSIAPVQDGLTYDLRLRGITDDGETSGWALVNGHTVVGKTTPPPDVVTLVYESGRLRWTYPAPPLDLDGFLVRAHAGNHAAWDSATPLHDGVIGETGFSLARDSGMRTYLVKAVDVAGNESASPAYIVINLGDAPIDNAVATIDLRADGFPGTITNGSIVGGDLVADSTTFFWIDDAAPFWKNDAATFWPTDTFTELTYMFRYTPPVEHLAGKIRLALTVAADFWRVEYRRDVQTAFWKNDAEPFWGADTDLFWPVSSADWIVWPGELAPLLHEQYEFRIVCAAGLTQGIISACQIVVDLPDVEETLQDVAISAAGTRLPITQSYLAIKAVTASLKGDGSTAMKIEVVDRNILGPLVRAVDAAGAPTTATLSTASVTGY